MKMKNWLFQIALKKVLVKVITLLASFAGSAKLTEWGISFNMDPSILATVIFAKLELLRNYLKQKGYSWL